MARESVKILRRLIESVIIPKYPQIGGVYDIYFSELKHGNGYFYVILTLKEYKGFSEIVNEIHDLFKMVGLDIADENTFARKMNFLNKLTVDHL